jgi:polar amino acid transport system substrate-binding protein
MHRLFGRREAVALLGGLGLFGLSAMTPRARAESLSLQGRTLTIGIHNRAPWGYRDTDGNVVGLHPDIARAALMPLGADGFDFVVADFGALIPGLLAQRFDLVASGVAITPARCQQVIFSEPDVAVGDGLLVMKGNPLNLHGYADITRNPDARLGGGRGTENMKNALAAGVPEGQMLYFPNNEAVVSAMLAGRVDAATLSAPSVAGIMADKHIEGIERALPFQGLVKANGKPALLYTAMVFRQDETALRDAYNGRLAAIKQDGTLRQILGRYGFSDDDVAPPVSTEDICAGNG